MQIRLPRRCCFSKLPSTIATTSSLFLLFSVSLSCRPAMMPSGERHHRSLLLPSANMLLFLSLCLMRQHDAVLRLMPRLITCSPAVSVCAAILHSALNDSQNQQRCSRRLLSSYLLHLLLSFCVTVTLVCVDTLRHITQRQGKRWDYGYVSE